MESWGEGLTGKIEILRRKEGKEPVSRLRAGRPLPDQARVGGRTAVRIPWVKTRTLSVSPTTRTPVLFPHRGQVMACSPEANEKRTHTCPQCRQGIGTMLPNWSSNVTLSPP